MNKLVAKYRGTRIMLDNNNGKFLICCRGRNGFREVSSIDMITSDSMWEASKILEEYRDKLSNDTYFFTYNPKIGLIFDGTKNEGSSHPGLYRSFMDSISTDSNQFLELGEILWISVNGEQTQLRTDEKTRSSIEFELLVFDIMKSTEGLNLEKTLYPDNHPDSVYMALIDRIFMNYQRQISVNLDSIVPNLADHIRNASPRYELISSLVSSRIKDNEQLLPVYLVIINMFRHRLTFKYNSIGSKMLKRKYNHLYTFISAACQSPLTTLITPTYEDFIR